MRKLLLTWLTLAFTLFAHAQYEQMESMIDPFTGNLRYSAPLLELSGPNGEHVPVTISYYNGGIRPHQSATWVGLGWNLGVGEITRHVKGVPDDWNGKVRSEYSLDEKTTKNITYYGPLYFDNFPSGGNPSHSMDIYNSIQMLDGNVFTGIAYDDFHISGPGIQGGMGLFVPEYGKLKGARTQTKVNLCNGTLATSTNVDFDNDAPFSFGTSPVFLWDGLPGNYINSAVNPWLTSYPKQKESNTLYSESILNQTAYGPGTTNSVIGRNSGAFYSNGNPVSGYYIKYFTNNEINNSQAGDFLHPTVTVSRTEQDLIGGFQITTPDGITYHYSLPVYVLEENHYSYSEGTGSFDAKYGQSTHSNNYAVSWKLTAITGPNYKNNAPLTSVGEEDEGYWIAYDYAKWGNDGIAHSSPQIGVNKDIMAPATSITSFDENYGLNTYTETVSASRVETERYYINKIRTATHQLLFYKGIRNDNVSFFDGNDKVTPLLRLEKIILVKNEDAQYFETTIAPSLSSISNLFTTAISTTGIFWNNISNYTQYEEKILQSVDFTYDYTLRKLDHRNIKYLEAQTFQKDVVAGTITLYNVLQPNSPTGQTGVLTLKNIQINHLGGAQMLPDWQFSYTTNNPDFNIIKMDNWGYYKSDFSSGLDHYTSSASAGFVDAWSLVSILEPSGLQYDITYESDDYRTVGYAGVDKDHDIERPQRLFLISGVSFNSQDNSGGSNPDPETVLPDKYNFSFTFSGGSPSTLLSDLSNKKITLYLRFNGKCKVEHNHQNIPTGLHDYYSNLGYGEGSFNDLSHVLEGKWHPNALYGEVRYNSSGNALSAGQSLWSFDNSLMKASLRPDLFFYNLYATWPQTDNSTYRKVDCGCAGVPITYSPTLSWEDYEYDYQNRISDFQYGYLKVEDLATEDFVGGGVRVAEIELKEPQTDQVFRLEAEYEKGFTPIEPDRFSQLFLTEYTVHFANNFANIIEYPQGLYLSSYRSDPLSMGPNVGYDKVVFNRIGSNGENGIVTTMKFNNSEILYRETRTVNDNRLGLNAAETQVENLVSATFAEIVDKSGLYGKMFEVEKVGSDGFEKVKIHHGIIGNYREIFTHVKSKGASPTYINYNYSYLVKPTYGMVKKVTNRDGVIASTHFNYSDPNIRLHLQPTITEVDPLGKSAYSKTTYLFEQISAYGSKNESSMYSNLLTSTTENEAYHKVINNGFLESTLLAATKTDYVSSVLVREYDPLNDAYTNTQKSMNFPLIERSYVNDGFSYPISYKQVLENTRYTSVGQLIESKDVLTGQFVAVWSHPLYHLQVASANNANYKSFAYSGFEERVLVEASEYHFSCEITSGQLQELESGSIEAHSGNYVAKIPSGSTGPVWSAKCYASPDEELGIIKGRRYRAMVWINSNSNTSATLNVTLTGTSGGTSYQPTYTRAFTDVDNLIIGEWRRMTIDFDVPADFVGSAGTNGVSVFVDNTSGTGDTYIDDMMIAPLTSEVSATVYNYNNLRTEATINSEGMYTRYVYDEAGRVTHIYVETPAGEYLAEEFEYNLTRD